MGRTGAFGTVTDDMSRVLLVHRRDIDVWETPGGVVEGGEAPWAAVVREVHEETGLTVAVERLVGVYWCPRGRHLVFQFLCRPTAGVASPSDEADAARFFDL